MSLQLSARQLEVVRCIERGLTNEEIAVELGVSTSTVKTHIRDLRIKFNVSRKRYIPQLVRDLGLLG